MDKDEKYPESEDVEDTEDTSVEDEDVKAKTEKLKLKRLPDLDDAHDEYIKTLIGFPKTALKELGKVAEEKSISKGALVRTAVKEYLEKLKNPPKENPEETIIEDSELTELLESCKTFWGNFKTIDADGFFEKFSAQEWQLDDLTDRQFIELCAWLKVGYEGFSSKPDIEEFLGWAKKLKPTKEQLAFLKLWLENNVTIDEADKEKTLAELTTEIEQLATTGEE